VFRRFAVVLLLVCVLLMFSRSEVVFFAGAVDRVEDGDLAVIEVWHPLAPLGVAYMAVLPVSALAAVGVAPRGRFVAPVSLLESAAILAIY